MEIYLGTFLKRVNSTARPAVESLTRYECTMRRQVSVLAPTVMIKSDSTLSGYNYGYIPRYNRYYHVSDIQIGPRGYWTIILSVDVLATYKPEISAATEYVARAAAAYDGDIQDGMYTSKAGARVLMSTVETPWITDLYNGTFIVSCVNSQSYATSTALTYYAMSAAEYASLLKALQNRTTMSDILGIVVDDDGIVTNLTGCLSGISYDVYLAQVNPIQYVVGSVYLPLDRDQLTVGSEISVYLGPYDMGITAPTVGYRREIDMGTIDVPKHPQATSRGEYLNLPPHSVYSMNFPGFGVVELDGARLGRWDTVHAKIVLDPYNGNAYLYLNTADPDEDEGALAILPGNIGIPVPVTQMLATNLTGNLIANVAKVASNVLSNNGGAMTSLSEAFGGLFQAIGAVAEMAIGGTFGTLSGNDPMEKLVNAGVQVKNAFDSPGGAGIIDGVQSIPTLTTTGSGGGSSALYGNWWLKLEYFILVDEDNESLGRPLMQTRQLGTLSGYIQVIGPHVKTGGTAQETAEVNRNLSSGFFME